MAARSNTRLYVLCVRNSGFAASLEVRKVYRLRPDRDALNHGLLRVIDDSGEDYLYPERFFVPIEVPRAAAGAFARSN